MEKLRILNEGEVGRGILVEKEGHVLIDRSQPFIQSMTLPTLTEGERKPFVNEFTCILQKFDIRNKNGRIYPERILRREAERYADKIKSGTSLGELDHPDSTDYAGDRISHLITDIWFEGNTLCGKIKLLLSEAFKNQGQVFTKGDLIATYIKEGVRVGVSSRGVGSVESKNGINEVQDDFELICWDVVLQPSTPNAYIFVNHDDRKPFLESNHKLIDKANKFLKG